MNCFGNILSSYASSCVVISLLIDLGAVDELGDMPYYAEHCAAMLAVTYSSGQGMQRNIVSDFFIQTPDAVLKVHMARIFFGTVEKYIVLNT